MELIRGRIMLVTEGNASYVESLIAKSTELRNIETKDVWRLSI